MYYKTDIYILLIDGFECVERAKFKIFFSRNIN
jgi:hypothetical protein